MSYKNHPDLIRTNRTAPDGFLEPLDIPMNAFRGITLEEKNYVLHELRRPERVCSVLSKLCAVICLIAAIMAAGNAILRMMDLTKWNQVLNLVVVWAVFFVLAFVFKFAYSKVRLDIDYDAIKNNRDVKVLDCVRGQNFTWNEEKHVWKESNPDADETEIYLLTLSGYYITPRIKISKHVQEYTFDNRKARLALILTGEKMDGKLVILTSDVAMM